MNAHPHMKLLARARVAFGALFLVLTAAVLAVDVGLPRAAAVVPAAVLALAWLWTVASLPRGLRARWAGVVAWTAASFTLLAL